MCALREPSLGPCFGVKGGAAGGGYAQVIPMEDINLHFTGDFHAITSAHNLLAALIDNHVYWGNTLGIDPRRVAWRRVLDMNDRALRSIVNSLGGVANGFPREDGFDITVASEVMAIFCLASDLDDLKKRLANIIVGYTRDKKPVTAADLKAHGAMTALMKHAMNPRMFKGNYAQVKENPGKLWEKIKGVKGNVYSWPQSTYIAEPPFFQDFTMEPQAAEAGVKGARIMGLFVTHPRVDRVLGHGETKKTCLWLRGLRPLYHSHIVTGREQRIFNMQMFRCF